MAKWSVIGQVGTIAKNNKSWSISIAENIFEGNKKVDTIWYNCLSFFEPRGIEVGDTVLVEGQIQRSLTPKYPYAFVINHMGLIKK